MKANQIINIKKVKIQMIIHNHKVSDLAIILKKSKEALYPKLQGIRSFTVGELIVLSKVYNVDINYFITE